VKLCLRYTRTELQFALKDNTVTLLAVLYWCEKVFRSYKGTLVEGVWEQGAGEKI
jgi:hypothetical protein